MANVAAPSIAARFDRPRFLAASCAQSSICWADWSKICFVFETVSFRSLAAVMVRFSPAPNATAPKMPANLAPADLAVSSTLDSTWP
jgi:hypothetical protein